MAKTEVECHKKSINNLEKAVRDYVGGKASLGGAAETAGMSYCDFREELRKRRLLFKGKIGITHR